MKSLISLLVVVVLLVGIGWQSADWRAGNMDKKIRDSLLMQAVRISRTIDPELVKKLTFTSADRGTPAFEQIRKQMVAYGNIIFQRGIYSMALRDDSLVFGPENYADNDPMASMPGTVYQKPSIEDYKIFNTGKPIVIGPKTDEYGTFISALAPVYDPRTSEVLMTIGIDFMSDDWQAAINATQYGPMFITLILILVLLFGAQIVYRRNRMPGKQGLLWHVETIVVAIFGIILTVTSTFLISEAKNLEQSHTFIRISDAMAETISQTFCEIKNNIAAIARFKEGSIHVDREEFAVFSEPMTRTSGIQEYQIVSIVSWMDKSGFEDELRRNDVEDFFIWEKTPQNERIPVSDRTLYYPVSHVVPWNNNNKIDVGFDLGSDPRMKILLEESVRTGLSMATGSIILIHDDVEEPNMLFIHPIFQEDIQSAISQGNDGFGKQIRGFAMGVIRLESILDAMIRKHSEEGLFVEMHLVDLADERAPTLLALYPRDQVSQHPVILDKDYLGQYKQLIAYPEFSFGRPLAIISHATPAFYDMHLLREILLIGFGGLFLTAVLTLFTGFLRNRNLDLEFQVQERASAFHESENQFRMLVENAINGVALHEIVLDEYGDPVDYIFLQANPGFERHTGLKVAEVVGRRATDVFPGIEKNPCINIYGKVALTGKPITFEQFFEPLERHYLINAYQVGRGRFATVFVDITEQKQSEEEKNKLQAQLAQAQKMEAVGRLAGGVAHDFNNMLSVIVGYTEMASEKLPLSNPIQQDLKEVFSAAKRSTELVRQLMAFARKQLISPVILNLNDCVSGMLKMLRRLIGEDINLVWMPGHALWNVKIDPSQIDQFLANLMVNARDAIEGAGRVTIETHNVLLDQDYCRVHAGSVPGAYVLLAVSDNGCGMEKETQANIFEPFFTTKGIGKGTGLGLSTVFGIVKQNKGYINVYSEPGQGTTFKIYLPRFAGEAISNEANEIVKEPVGGKETILLVEDEEAVLKLAKTMLQRLGYIVLSAEKPSEAIQMADEYEGDIHLLITDVVMPEMNGVKLAERLNSMRPKMKCLFMSGYTANVIAHLGILSEDMHLIQKPFSFNILAHKVRGILD
jgi:signal transduction histidine kinase/CHASE1-domain containing sensor protein